jgi:hypothetical protein
MNGIIEIVGDAINGTSTSIGVQETIAAKQAKIDVVTAEISEVTQNTTMSEIDKVKKLGELNVTLKTLNAELDDLKGKLLEKKTEEESAKANEEIEKIANAAAEETKKDVINAATSADISATSAERTDIDFGGKRKSKRRSNKKKRNSKKKKGGKRKSASKRK